MVIKLKLGILGQVGWVGLGFGLDGTCGWGGVWYSILRRDSFE